MVEEKRFYKTPKDIENETGRKFLDICKELLDKGYAPVEIAEKLKLKNSRYVSKVIFLEEVRIKNPPNPIFKGAKNLKDYEKISQDKLGISFKQFLQEKYIDGRLSLFEIAGILDTSNSSANRYLRKYNLKKSPQQAKEDAIIKGVLNYDKNLTKSRKTMKKRSTSSTSQEYTRELVQSYFVKALTETPDLKHYEVIIGYNEYGILKDSEVDIPIVIINNMEKKLYKYSIEYNGSYFHKNMKERDARKKQRLTKNGWIHKVIDDKDGDFFKLENQVSAIVNDIIAKLPKV